MHILLIVHGFPPDALGGTELYSHDLALALHRLGERVSVVTREATPGRHPYEVRRDRLGPIPVLRIQNDFGACDSFEDSYRNPRLRAVVAGLLDELQPQVAHIQHLTCLSTEIVEELGRRRIPSLLTLNDYWMICHRGQLFDRDLHRCEGPLDGCRRCLGPEAATSPAAHRAAGTLQRLLPARAYRWLRRSVGGAADRFGSPDTVLAARDRRVAHMQHVLGLASLIQAPSRTLQERFLAFGVDHDRIFYEPQGIDLARFATELRQPAERLRIGFLGSLMVSKSPHLLFEAFRGIDPGRASLSVYGGWADYHGDDSYRTRVEPLLKGIPLAHFGPVEHDEIPRVLASLDVLVICSTWIENAPFVIREAFAAGLPVVASRLGGMAELVSDGVDGLLFSPGDSEQLRRALQRLLDEPELLERLRSGLPEMKGIDEDAATQRRRYRELVERSRGGGTTAIVLNYRTPEDTVFAVRSLQAADRPPERILMIDNHSDDGSLERIRSLLPEVDILASEQNLGFSGGCNLGIERAMADGARHVLLVNSDAILPPELPGRLEEELRGDSKLGIVGPVILARSHPHRVGSAGMSWSPASGRMRHLAAGADHQPALGGQVDGISGAIMMIRRELLEQVGGFDEEYFFSFEDLDFCLRARAAGWRVAVAPGAIAYHQGSRSMGYRSPERIYYATRNHLLLARRHAPGTLRALSILAINLAHVLLTSPVPRAAALRAWFRAGRDHLRGCYGPA